MKFLASDTNKNDEVSVFSHPERDTKYTIGVDGALGVGRDYTSIVVFSNRIPFEQVAWIHSKTINTVDGSRVMIDLARYYNKAMLVIETRQPGNAYQDNAIQVYNYHYLYQAEQHLDESPTVSSKFGICTTEAWKNLLVNETKKLLEHKVGGVSQPQVIFNDPFTLQCFCNFVYVEDKRKMEATEGANDDPVMASMLALHGCLLRPQPPRPKRQKFDLTEDEAHKEYLLKKHFERIMKGKKVERV